MEVLLVGRQYLYLFYDVTDVESIHTAMENVLPDMITANMITMIRYMHENMAEAEDSTTSQPPANHLLATRQLPAKYL